MFVLTTINANRALSMEKKAPKISIIVPCYNAEKYIKRCLDSLLNQTLTETEIICIDDKSTDNTLAVLKAFASSDNRLRIIEQNVNRGAAAARNTGLEVAAGEYIGFVDSDDYVDADFFEKMYNQALATGADIIKANAKITEQNSCKRFDDRQNERIRLYGKWRFLYQWWTGLYHGSLIRDNKIKFPDNIISGQDIVFLSLCVAAANRVALVPDTFYHYLRRDDSLDSPILSPEKLTAKINAIKIIADIYNHAEMNDDDYVFCFHQRWVLLKSLIDRTPYPECKKQVIDAFIRMYNSCKDKTELLGLYAKYDQASADIIGYVKSGDTAGILRCVTVEQNVAPNPPAPTQSKYTVYLFSFLPLLNIKKKKTGLTVKILGLPLLKSKKTNKGYRVNILFIPLIRIKRK